MTKREQAIAAWEQSSWDDVAAFIGPNAERFRVAYGKGRAKAIDKGNGVAIGWSWPAFIFSFAWFAYRKQWIMAMTLIVLPLVIGYFVTGSGALTGLAVAMAMMGKSLYLQDAVTKIARIKAKGGGHDRIATAGGVSIPGGIAGGILWVLAAAAAIFTIIAGRAT